MVASLIVGFLQAAPITRDANKSEPGLVMLGLLCLLLFGASGFALGWKLARRGEDEGAKLEIMPR
jgi:hypothetical protein